MLLQFLLEHDPRGQQIPVSRRVLADMARYHKQSVSDVIRHLRAGAMRRSAGYRYVWVQPEDRYQ